MTTLAANQPRKYQLGNFNDIPVIATDIIFEGAGIGIVKASGHGRPLVAGDIFGGFAQEKADNSAGSAADINVRATREGQIEVSISGLVITDVNHPVYMSDDNVFTLVGVSNTPIGYVKRFVSSGVGVVQFFAGYIDPFGENINRETKSANYTMDEEDTGKIIYQDTDAKTITLPATVIGYEYTFVNAGAYGTVIQTISPNASDQIIGSDLAGVDDKDIINTKATAQRGDYIILKADGAQGWFITDMKGVWAAEA